ncbi:Ribosomal protein S11 [Dillenia turbinata]|uniref:Ribosomal protein S11 n=1 Tax=Dillenia turbinata TaxID=194707 RepID=A0AAN8V2C7_9MAGN
MLGFVRWMSRRGPTLSLDSALRIFTRGCLKCLNLGRSLLSTSSMEFQAERSSRSMDFVRGLIVEDGRDYLSKPSLPNTEVNADIVHIKLIRNNTFVTVTDSKGNKKFGASSGSLSEMKGGPKLSRYAAEATAEHVGRLARSMGLKSVVMKVNGFSFFKKKRQAIMSFRDGYTNSRGDINPIVYIEDTTRRPHNGCRLRKKRRV